MGENGLYKTSYRLSYLTVGIIFKGRTCPVNGTALLLIEPLRDVPYLRITIATSEKEIINIWEGPFLGETRKQIDGNS